jgi:hypothetical protein
METQRKFETYEVDSSAARACPDGGRACPGARRDSPGAGRRPSSRRESLRPCLLASLPLCPLPARRLRAPSSSVPPPAISLTHRESTRNSHSSRNASNLLKINAGDPAYPERPGAPCCADFEASRPRIRSTRLVRAPLQPCRYLPMLNAALAAGAPIELSSARGPDAISLSHAQTSPLLAARDPKLLAPSLQRRARAEHAYRAHSGAPHPSTRPTISASYPYEHAHSSYRPPQNSVLPLKIAIRGSV